MHATFARLEDRAHTSYEHTSYVNNTLNLLVSNYASRLMISARTSGHIGERCWDILQSTQTIRRVPRIDADDARERSLAEWLFMWKRAGMPQLWVAPRMLIGTDPWCNTARRPFGNSAPTTRVFSRLFRHISRDRLGSWQWQNSSS